MTAAVDTPCIKVCVMHPTEGLCLGCWRTLAEIAAWSTMAPAARQAVMADLPARAKAVKNRRRGGRTGRLARDAD